VKDEDRAHRGAIRAWALYDVGNSAFFLTVVAAVFPFFFQELYSRRHAGAEESLQVLRVRGGAALAWAAAAAMLAVAVAGPLLGALADRKGLRKRLLAAFALLGVLSSAGLAFVGPEAVEAAALLYALGSFGVAGSIVFYDALLPFVARPRDLDRVSALGFSAGYLGSVLLFLLQIAFILKPGLFGLADADAGARAAFFSVAVWWALFTIPLLRRVPEPPGDGVVRRRFPLSDLRDRKPLLLFLAAYWAYADGIGTIIRMATAFGFALGLEKAQLLGALVLTQVVGVPCALGFGLLARRFGPKPVLMAGLGVYGLICAGALLIREAWHFYLLAGAVGLVQGGTQALSRSLYASMVPEGRSAEFFGLYGTVEKAAGIGGPLLLGFVWSDGGDPRRGVAAVLVFFVVGALLLAGVRRPEPRPAPDGDRTATGPSTGPGP
jgi:UMF1 family MFS transporter